MGLKEKKVVLVAGMPGSGKSIVSKVARDMGFGTVCMGDVVREEVEKRGLSLTRDNISKIARELRKREGMQAIAIRVLDRILELLSKGLDLVVVDGVRGYDEVKYFKDNLGRYAKLIVLTVHASPETRFKRLCRRGREDDPRTWEEFLRRDLEELNFGIGEVIALSDILLVNEGLSIKEFRELVESVISSIINKTR